MRTTRRLAFAAAVLGGGLVLAGPAAAQAVDCDQYADLAECQIDEDLGGTDDGAGSQDEDDTDDADEVEAGSAGGGGSQGTTSNAASLPFTGGEVTLIALAGTAALGGGIALTAAGRKRSTV